MTTSMPSIKNNNSKVTKVVDAETSPFSMAKDIYRDLDDIGIMTVGDKENVNSLEMGRIKLR